MGHEKGENRELLCNCYRVSGKVLPPHSINPSYTLELLPWLWPPSIIYTLSQSATCSDT